MNAFAAELRHALQHSALRGQQLQLRRPLAAPMLPKQLRADVIQTLDQAQIPDSVASSLLG
jgi:hypothetical protein